MNPDEALAVARAQMSRLEERWESWENQIPQKPKHCGGGSIAGSVQRRLQVVAKMHSEAQLVKLRDGC